MTVLIVAPTASGKTWLSERYPRACIDGDVIIQHTIGWPKKVNWWYDEQILINDGYRTLEQYYDEQLNILEQVIYTIAMPDEIKPHFILFNPGSTRCPSMKRLIKARKVLVVLPTPAEHRRNLRERRKAKNWSQPTAYSVLSNDRARIERFAKRQHIPTFTLTAIEAKINAIEQERYILELEELGVDWAAQKGLEVLAEMYYS